MPAKHHKHPLARRAALAEHLRRKALPVDRLAAGNLNASDLGQRGQEVNELGEIVADPPGRNVPGPRGDKRHAAATFEEHALGPAEFAAADRGPRRLVAIGAVIAGEDHERLLAEPLAVEFGHQPADELVHVGDVVGEQILAVWLAVGRGQDVGVNVGQRVVDVKRPVLVAVDEVEYEPLAQIGHVLSLRPVLLFAVDRVGVSLRRGPVGAAPLGADVLVEAPVGRLQRDLAPLARAGGGVAAGLKQLRDHHLLVTAGLEVGDGRLVVARHASAEAVAAGHHQRPRGAAVGRAVAGRKSDPVRRERVDVRRREVVGPVTAHRSDTEVVGEDHDDVGLRGAVGGRRKDLGASGVARQHSHHGKPDKRTES